MCLSEIMTILYLNSNGRNIEAGVTRFKFVIFLVIFKSIKNSLRGGFGSAQPPSSRLVG
jgi:hypothetical protein